MSTLLKCKLGLKILYLSLKLSLKMNYLSTIFYEKLIVRRIDKILRIKVEEIKKSPNYEKDFNKPQSVKSMADMIFSNENFSEKFKSFTNIKIENIEGYKDLIDKQEELENYMIKGNFKDNLLLNKFLFHICLEDGYIKKAEMYNKRANDLILKNDISNFDPLVISTRLDKIMIDNHMNEKISTINDLTDPIFEEIAKGLILKDDGICLKGFLYLAKIYFYNFQYENVNSILHLIGKYKKKIKNRHIKDLFATYFIIFNYKLKPKFRRDFIKNHSKPNLLSSLISYCDPSINSEDKIYRRLVDIDNAIDLLEKNNLNNFIPQFLIKKSVLQLLLGRKEISDFYIEEAEKMSNKFDIVNSNLELDFYIFLFMESIFHGIMPKKNYSKLVKTKNISIRNLIIMHIQILSTIDSKKNKENLKIQLNKFIEMHSVIFNNQPTNFLYSITRSLLYIVDNWDEVSINNIKKLLFKK